MNKPIIEMDCVDELRRVIQMFTDECSIVGENGGSVRLIYAMGDNGVGQLVFLNDPEKMNLTDLFKIK